MAHTGLFVLAGAHDVHVTYKYRVLNKFAYFSQVLPETEVSGVLGGASASCDFPLNGATPS